MKQETLFFKENFKFLNANSLNLKDNLRINEQISHCNLCNLCKIKKSVVLLCDKKADILFVSSFFDKNFNPHSLLNFDANIAYSSLLRCEIKNEMLENFLKFVNLKDSFEFCKNYIEYEIQKMQPKIIVALGKEVFSALAGESNDAYSMLRGGFYRLKNSFILPTHSLTYLKKNPSIKNEIIADLATLKGLI